MFIRRIFKRPSQPPGKYKLTAGKRVYAIGDIHGRLDLLDLLLEKIRDDDRDRSAACTHLIFLGDLIDRGPDSRGVVERLLKMKEAGQQMTVLKGNHEEILLEAALGDLAATRLLTRVGGMQTVLSYGMSMEEYISCDLQQLSSRIIELVPKRHMDFLRSFSDYVQIDDYLFVHAGVRPGAPLEEQSSRDLRWIRSKFLDSTADHGCLIVHGHSISPTVDIRENRIGIDTGAFASGTLTALGLEGRHRWFIQATGSPDPSWGTLTD